MDMVCISVCILSASSHPLALQPMDDHNMEDVMDAPMDSSTLPHPQPQMPPQQYGAHHANQASNGGECRPALRTRFAYISLSAVPVLTELDRLYEQMRAVVVGASQNREPFRDISVKVHIRRPERDTWAYMGRGIVSQEITGQSSRVGEHFRRCSPARVSEYTCPPSCKSRLVSQDSHCFRRGLSFPRGPWGSCA